MSASPTPDVSSDTLKSGDSKNLFLVQSASRTSLGFAPSRIAQSKPPHVPALRPLAALSLAIFLIEELQIRVLSRT
jgi:hypothetical protein